MLMSTKTTLITRLRHGSYFQTIVYIASLPSLFPLRTAFTNSTSLSYRKEFSCSVWTTTITLNCQHTLVVVNAVYYSLPDRGSKCFLCISSFSMWSVSANNWYFFRIKFKLEIAKTTCLSMDYRVS